ncbi:MAG TPA: hypothetical protein DEG44_05665 [Candidatus Kerfeldbacteria bacterium]|nr:hypothetical protein [Candidatus Kerfeldbacteria bacterium]
MTKQCRQCSKSFKLEQWDLDFYQRIAVPQPSLCPDCRQQRRLTYRNERKLYQDQCDLCQRQMISLYSTDSPYTVYCQDCWWSDRWNPLDYARDYNPTRSFFEQWHELQLAVPRIALFNLHSTNSEYTNHSVRNKNCYMGVAMGECEDSLYGHWVLKSKNCVDNLYCEQCELCYECSYCRNCFQTFWSQYCEAANDCLFCFECSDIQNCLGCVQLQHKQYYILNRPASAEEFADTKQKLLTHPEFRAKFIVQWEALKFKAPRRFDLQIHCEQSTGNDLYHCRNAKFCFNCRNLDNAKYMFDLGDNKDSMDAYEHGWLVPSELIYEAHAGMAGYNLKFCNICADSRDLQYCDCCFQGSSNLFGCIGLKKSQYCILNKPYSEMEYHQLEKKIIEQMRTAGEYGEFFPIRYAPFAYNESAAPEYFPCTPEQVTALGGRWQVEDRKQYKVQTYRVLSDSTLVSDDILQALLACTQCQKNYRINQAELKFYRQTGVPIPDRCSDCRHLNRMQLRNPRQLWQRQCMCTQTDHAHHGRCSVEFETTFSPERKELVYCEQCYQKEVY